MDLKVPADPNHGLDLKAMARAFVERYNSHKRQSKQEGLEGPGALAGVHHPIFRGKPVNFDPRERLIAGLIAKRGDYNVFHACYRELVQALYACGASPYVFCVNVGAVIAALLPAVCGRLSIRCAERAGSGDRGVHSCLAVRSARLQRSTIISIVGATFIPERRRIAARSWCVPSVTREVCAGHTDRVIAWPFGRSNLARPLC